MQLTSVEIPVAFYGISKNYGNNFLYLKAIYKSFTDANELLTDEKIVIFTDCRWGKWFVFTSIFSEFNCSITDIKSDSICESKAAGTSTALSDDCSFCNNSSQL